MSSSIGQSGEWTNQNFSTISFSSNEVSYTFYSENLDRLNEAVGMVEDVMSENDRLEDVESTTEDAYVEYTFNVEQDKLLQYGLTAGQIVMMLSTDQSKELLTTIEKDGEVLEVIVQKEQTNEQPKSIDEMLEKQVPTAQGSTCRFLNWYQ